MSLRRFLSGSITLARQVHGRHLHQINGFTVIKEALGAGEAVWSVPFAVGRREWQVLLYPNGIDAGHRGFVSADLRLDSGRDATASYRVSILDFSGNPAHSKAVGPRRFTSSVFRSSLMEEGLGELGGKTGIDELVDAEELRRSAPFLLDDDCLNVMCDVTVMEKETMPNRSWFIILDSIRRFVAPTISS